MLQTEIVFSVKLNKMIFLSQTINTNNIIKESNDSFKSSFRFQENVNLNKTTILQNLFVFST